MKKNVVVLSSRGFIGKTTVETLKANSELTIYELTSENCNLLDPQSTAQAFSRLPDTLSVVFLSTFGRLPVDDFYVYSRNVAMVSHLITAMLSKKIENIVFTSSVCMYGRPPLTLPVTEDIRIDPSGHYGLSKYVSEQLLRYNFPCPLSVVRIPGAYGEYDRGRSIVSAFIENMRTNKPINLVDGGSQIRDFVYGKDVAQAIAHFIEQPYNGTVNIASDDKISMLELTHLIAEEMKVVPEIKYHPATTPSFDLYFDLTRMKTLLPFHHPTPVKEGIRNLLNARRFSSY
jgi:UDP-glucose 4-epimerase